MSDTTHRPGRFCFPELDTKDMDGAKRFYGELFGWKALDVPSAQGGYSLLQLDGKDVAGLHRSEQSHPCWQSYVAVESADATAARAAELGGIVRGAPFEVPGIGRMAMIEDPAGAMVALWQAKGHAGAAVVGRTGSMCWNELLVRDVSKARAFYEKLFGWRSEVSAMPSGPYTVFKVDEVPVAGLMPIAPEWGEVPPNWGVYFAVDDCDASVARAKTAGGALVAGPMDVPGVGRFAILSDPVFAVMRFERP